MLKETNFAWWIERFKHNMQLFGLIRVDHFRGLVAYWEIPAQEKTAINGQWIQVPSEDFFNHILQALPALSIIAEDLGIITPDVTVLMKKFGFPGMKILHFAFGEDIETHPYIPENYSEDCVVYTGTHDNNTTQGWLANDATEKEKENLELYFKHKVKLKDIHWDLMECAMLSKANLAIIPVQDILGLSKDERMNTPATTQNNWQWRLKNPYFKSPAFDRFQELTKKSKRVPKK
ncbi:MAG: 4-alpha-glucanotransferase [Candidatus Omnitrophota bacterium]